MGIPLILEGDQLTQMARWKKPWIFLAIVVAASCSVFTSKPVDKNFSRRAISYFLPTGRVHLTVDHKVSGTTDIAINEVIVPDTSQRYYAQLNSDPLSKDDFKISTPNGLLQQVTNTSEDQTPVVAKNLAIAARQTVELLATAAGAETADKTDLKIESTFDPFDENEVKLISDQLRLIGGELHQLKCPQNQENSAGSFSETAGFMYRPSYPYELRFTFAGISPKDSTLSYKPAPAGITQVLVNLPSKCSPVMSVEADRTAFGKNVTTINFASGTLADISVQKDSEIAGISQVPVDVTSELLKLPADLVTIRYKNVSDQSKLVEQQTTLLNDQKNLLKAQQDLIAAQAAANQKPTPTPTPTPDVNLRPQPGSFPTPAIVN